MSRASNTSGIDWIVELQMDVLVTRSMDSVSVDLVSSEHRSGPDLGDVELGRIATFALSQVGILSAW